MAEMVLEVKNLKKYFPLSTGVFSVGKSYVKAVENVSFNVAKGETVGLVGESGCGKTTVARTVIRLYDKTDGEVMFKGRDIFALKKTELRKMRPQMQIIFQDPYSSLNPRLTVFEIVSEALINHQLCTKKEAYDIVKETLDLCGMAPHTMSRYPHEFSGGQRQRIGIARALVLKPDFIVADEPVSALDVSIQSQIINLLCDLQEKFGFSYLFISHDLSVVRHICHKVGVMYLGSLVEFAEKNDLYNDTMHPYTKALLSAVPVADPTYKKDRVILQGDLPSPSTPPPGCRFHTRCPECMDICRQKEPEYMEKSKGHFVACHLVNAK